MLICRSWQVWNASLSTSTILRVATRIQPHNTVTALSGTSQKTVCKAAFSHPTGRSSTSAVCCRRSSLGCQPPTPGQLAPHIASRHKQHLQTATSVPLANSRRAQQVPAVPSRHSPSGCDGPDADTRGISGVQPVHLHSTKMFVLGLPNATRRELSSALACSHETLTSENVQCIVLLQYE